MILIFIVFAVLTLLMLISYLNALKTSDKDLLATVTNILNIIFIFLVIFGLIAGSMVYYLCVTHIEDLNKQCYINTSVFFASLFLIAVLVIGGDRLKHNNHPAEDTFLKTIDNFLFVTKTLTIAVSVILILTISIMSCFWCQIKVNRTLLRRNNANEVGFQCRVPPNFVP